MRKRLREKGRLKDNLAAEQRKRQKLKASEILAQEIECCEKTLDDAKRSYEALKFLNLQADKNLHLETVKLKSLPPIPVDVTSLQGSRQKYLALPMLPDEPDSPAISPIDCEDISVDTSGLLMEAQDLLPEVKQSSKGSLEMQCKETPELLYPGVPIAEVSQVFVSFLQRLTQHGIAFESSTVPDFVKNALNGCHTGTSTDLGAEQPEGLDLSDKDNQETLSFVKLTSDKRITEETGDIEVKIRCSVDVIQEDIAKELKESEREKSSVLEFFQEKVVCNINSTEPKTASPLNLSKEVDELRSVEADDMGFQNDLLVLGRSESDIEDTDGFKHLWDTMEFSRACMHETRNRQVLDGSNQNDSCSHEFYLKDDTGLVCSKCGFVGQDAEYIFNYIWGEKYSKKHSRKELLVTNTRKGLPLEDSDELKNLSPCKSSIELLTVHPQYKDKLRVHQEAGIRFLECNLLQDEPSGCILAHAPGTGKSFTVIAFLQGFQAAFPNEKPLIVAPKGMLSVWAREFQKWKVEDLTVFNLQETTLMEVGDNSENDVIGHQLKRHRQLQMLRQWMAQKSVLMVGYSTFSALAGDKDAGAFTEIKKLLLEATGILILDEGHFPRNKKAHITQSLLQVRTKRRVLLSGTLFQNNFDELYNLYHLVKPDFLSSDVSCTKALLESFLKAKSFSANGGLTPSKSPRKRTGREAIERDIFRNLGETIRSGEEGEKRQAISILRDLSRPFVHWYKGEILADLPGLIDLTLYIRMTEKQQELLLSLPNKREKRLDFFTKFMRVCIHPALLKVDCDASQNRESQWNGIDDDPGSSSKIMFVLDLLQLAVPMKEKVVLFSKYLDPFYLLERILKKTWDWQLNKEILKIEGRTSLEERESTIDRFNEGSSAKVLFASIKTCGEGISLIGASRIVLLDVQWNPMVSRQAISRAFRIGQTRKVFVYRLVGADTKEEDAHLRATEKEWLAKQIFEGCSDGDYGMYCQEVDPLQVDNYFESQHLGENVVKCLRYHFM